MATWKGRKILEGPTVCLWRSRGMPMVALSWARPSHAIGLEVAVFCWPLRCYGYLRRLPGPPPRWRWTGDVVNLERLRREA